MNKPRLTTDVLADVAALIPEVARAAGEAFAAEIPAYGPDVRGPEHTPRVEYAIQVALEGFFALVSRPGVDPAASPEPATLELAYEFGRNEARVDRDMSALLAAYRVGARVAWHQLSEEFVERGFDASQVAEFAELVFAYIDHLSAASAAGHADEIAASGRAREQHRAQLAVALLEPTDAERLVNLAAVAAWHSPSMLTVAVLPASHARPALQHLDHRTLVVPGDVAPGLADDQSVLLIPGPSDRGSLVSALDGHRAMLGPTRAWTEAHLSYARAVRGLDVLGQPGNETVDTDDHLVELVLAADAEALADLRARVLVPLAQMRPATAERLAQTLRSWILHQGRRDDVAADLDVHPQTVRYRMGQLRDVFADRLTTPRGVLELTVALAAARSPLFDANKSDRTN
ncbi:MAG TPA: helix-turn-helix domain-containing protein [Acidimicrobiales bacterium]|nr:helix-turn-helix domain-containing protein [Acidimicrobiales bacterium]